MSEPDDTSSPSTSNASSLSTSNAPKALTRDSLSVAASALRASDPRENTLGQLEEVLVLVQGRMRAIAADSNAFLGFGGGYDAKMLAAWNGLATTCSKLLGQIEDMRGSDRRLGEAINECTRTFGMAISGPLGEEMRILYSLSERLCASFADPSVTRHELEERAIHIREAILRLTTNTIIRLMNDAASITIRTLQEQFRAY